LQLPGVDRCHATELHRQASTTQVLGTALGKRFASARLRSPQQLVARPAEAWRCDWLGGLHNSAVQLQGIDARTGDPLQGHGAMFECRLKRQWIDCIASNGIDRQLLADQVVPVERRKAVAGHDPVADARRQHGLAAT